MIDVISYKKKYRNDIPVSPISVLGINALPDISLEELRLITPIPQDGSYHSDVASSDKQPSLFNRIESLPKSFAPRGLSDEDIINSCGSRSLHDIADIDNVSQGYIDNVSHTISIESQSNQASTGVRQSVNNNGSNSVDPNVSNPAGNSD